MGANDTFGTALEDLGGSTITTSSSHIIMLGIHGTTTLWTDKYIRFILFAMKTFVRKIIDIEITIAVITFHFV